MAASSTIRLRPESHKSLKEIAQRTGESLEAALDRAIEDCCRRLYLEGLNADYAALRRAPKAWADFQKELGDLDVANEDGLEDV